MQIPSALVQMANQTGDFSHITMMMNSWKSNRDEVPSFIVVPVGIEETNHWCSIVVKLESKSVVLFDPMRLDNSLDNMFNAVIAPSINEVLV